jgi:hypothetical protein
MGKREMSAKEEQMDDLTIARHATSGKTPAEIATPRDAEIARGIAGLLLGRPFDHRLAIGPARIIAAYRNEAACNTRLEEFGDQYIKFMGATQARNQRKRGKKSP